MYFLFIGMEGRRPGYHVVIAIDEYQQGEFVEATGPNETLGRFEKSFLNPWMMGVIGNIYKLQQRWGYFLYRITYVDSTTSFTCVPPLKGVGPPYITWKRAKRQIMEYNCSVTAEYRSYQSFSRTFNFDEKKKIDLGEDTDAFETPSPAKPPPPLFTTDKRI